MDSEYIRDSFNLYGLKERIPKYKYFPPLIWSEAMKMILSGDSPDSEDLNDQG